VKITQAHHERSAAICLPGPVKIIPVPIKMIFGFYHFDRPVPKRALKSAPGLLTSGTALALNGYNIYSRFYFERRPMRFSRKFIGQKGQSNLAYILIGVALTIGVIFLLEYIHHENGDIEIHAPHVEVH
jgi:hypothetical protein